MTRDLTLYLPATVLEIEGLPDRAHRALSAVWGAHIEPSRDPPRRTRWTVTRAGEEYELSYPGFDSDRAASEALVAPRVEAALYGFLPRWHEGEAMLHAATLVCEGRAVVLVGESGSGKSSLSLAAVRAGWGYVTDELTLTDGELVRGISRTIQFDPAPVGTVLPERLRALDVESYRMTPEGGVEHAQPLVPWETLRVVREPLLAERAVVVRLDGQGPETVLEPIAASVALAALCEESRGKRTGPFGRLPGPGRAFRLEWRDPAEAVTHLASVVAAMG